MHSLAVNQVFISLVHSSDLVAGEKIASVTVALVILSGSLHFCFALSHINVYCN